MKRISYLLFGLGLSLSLACFAENPTPTKSSVMHLDKIIAIVNREAITQSELNTEMEQARKQLEHMNQPIPPQAEFRKKVLENLIDKNLQLQLCQSKNIKVPEEDVEKAIGNIAKANHLTDAGLKDALQQQGINYDHYKAQIYEQMLLQKLQQEEVAKSITFTPEDVTKFVKENKDKLNQFSAFHVIDILVPIPESSSKSQINQIRKEASTMAQLLQNTTDIDETLKKYPYSEKNDLGWRALPELPSLFQSKVAVMKINNASAPIQAPNGFHVLKLVDAKGENAKPTEKDLKNLAFQQKVNDAVKEWLVKLRSDSYIKIMN